MKQVFAHILFEHNKKYNWGEQIKARVLKYFYMKDRVSLDNIGQPDTHPLP